MVAFVRVLSLAALTATGAFGKPLTLRFKYSVKETHNVPDKWTRVADAPADAPIDLNIVLKQSNFAELERQLHAVSDPASSRYGQHLSEAEVNQLIRPTDKASNDVQEWLEAHGINRTSCHYSPAQDWVRVTLPVSDAESLLNTKYSVYKHEDGSTLIRTPQWSLPEHLHEHVMAVQPTNSFMRQTKFKTNFKPFGGMSLPDTEVPDVKQLYAVAQQNADIDLPNADVALACTNVQGVTPACLRALYKTVNYTPKAASKNSVGYCNFLGETTMITDFNQFIQSFRPDAAGATINFTTINNGDNQQTPLTPAQQQKQLDAEGNLDGETLVGIVYPTPIKAYNTGGQPPFTPDQNTQTNTNEPYADFLNYILQQQNIPQTISNSYGDDEQTVPPSYANAVCQQYAQLGARGVTVLFASGDNGVGPSGTCVSNDGSNKQMFLPSFPASCPYVTVVGATKGFAPEVAAYDPANHFSSGGGFSNYFGRPSYQDAAVTSYIQGLGTSVPANMYNASGRAYPDVAAQGQQYVVVWNGQNIQLDGTSASTPAMAGVIALVNDYLISNGKPAMGFMNPWLYSGGYKSFNDITSGNTLGCGGQGFPAKAGWDAVTGWGTPVSFTPLPHAHYS